MELQTQTQTQTLLPSPSSSTSSNPAAHGTPTIPTTPKQPQFPLTRSETNPYPTTFVQADTSSFKQVVQMLTGSSEPTSPPKPNPNPIPPIKSPTKSKPSKLYERRSTSLKSLRLSNSYRINNTNNTNNNNNNNVADSLSPSLLDFPSLVLSPVTPLIHDPFNRSPVSSSSSSPNVVVDRIAEDKAIAEKGFFLHPSPVSTPRDSEPRLLPLFPVSSPRVSSG